MSNQKTASTAKVVLKEVTQNDLRKIAQVHIDSFPESALTKLGVRIVQRYYLWQLIGQHKKVHAIGAFVDEECAGFSFSGVFKGSVSGFLDHNKFFLVKEVLSHPWLLFSPLFRERLYSGVQLLKLFIAKKKQSPDSSADRIEPRGYGILAIAVSPKYQKFGIGKMLMLDAEKEALKCGYKHMQLTVNLNNEKAITFYEKLNWQKSLQDNSWKGSMKKKIN